MTAVTESEPDFQHPVALAFAVAALQSVKGDNSNSMKVPTTCGEATASPNENDDCFVEHSSVMSMSEQCPGSGDDHTVATTLSTTPTVTTPTSPVTVAVAVSSTRGTAGTSKHTKQDAASRLARSRDRNREHARRTRIRKKAQLSALQTKVAVLESERVTLRQSIEECSIAGILLGLHQTGTTGKEENDEDEAAETQTLLKNVNSTKDASANSTSSTKVALLANGKRKRFLEQDENTPEAFKQPTQPIKLMIDGKTALVGGGKSHINWKTGIYIDHAGLHSKLTPGQLENLRYVLFRIILIIVWNKTRLAMLSCIALFSILTLAICILYLSLDSRERNRMHAKMTRDRKKCFIATIEKTINELESDVKRMRDILKQVSSAKFIHQVTPMGSPELSATEGPSFDDMDDDLDDDVDDDSSVYSQVVDDGATPVKKAKHDFSLND
jgi:hypothetical protein